MDEVTHRGTTFALDDDVYAPAEDSWMLADALARLDLTGVRAADAGCGVGVQAVTMAQGGARVVATDVNPRACELARRNAADDGVGDRVDVVRGNLLDAVDGGRLDVVACNPPYLPSAEDERVAGWLDRAFHGGDAGVDVALALVADLPRVLAPGGEAYVVLSTRGDVDAVRRRAHEAGLVGGEAVAEERFLYERVRVHRFRRGGDGVGDGDGGV